MSPVAFYRLLVILNGAVPLLMLCWDAYHGQLGANAVNHALHVTGTLALVFLLLALVITPLRWATGWGGWVEGFLPAMLSARAGSAVFAFALPE